MSLSVYRREYTLTECMHGVFAKPSDAQIRALSYADDYINQPSRGDFEQTLKYCYVLIHLTEFFELNKMKFIKLRHPFQFLLSLNDAKDVFVTTSHQAECIVQTLMLGSVLSHNLMIVLKMDRANHPRLLFMSDFDSLTDAQLNAHYVSMRKAIGLMHYCINKIVPRAFDTVRQLEDKAPCTVQFIVSYYNTLRVMAIWFVAAIKFRRAINTSDAEASTLHTQSGMRLMQECMMIVDGIKKRQVRNESYKPATSADVRPSSDVIVTRFMTILRNSCRYETDVRCSNNCNIKPDIRFAFHKRAKQLAVESDFPDECVWSEPKVPSKPKACDDLVLEFNRASVAGPIAPSVDVMKLGDDPLELNPFVFEPTAV